MRTILTILVVGLLAIPGLAMAQIDTLVILESTQITYDGQLVDYFVMDVGDPGDPLWFQFIQDSAYVMLVGAIGGVDTTILPEPIVWMKVEDPTVGDSWDGMLPSDGIRPTYEEIVGTKTVSVPAGNIFVYEIGVWGEDGIYLGEKWYGDGIGLVGWDITTCNESELLELHSYDLTPSSDFWPHDLGNEWGIESTDTATSVTADTATISVDGDPSDWAGLTPVIQDPSGDDTSAYTGNDIRDVYAAVDDTYLYVMVDFWDGSPDPAWGLSTGLAYVVVLDDFGDGNYVGLAISFAPGLPGQWFAAGINFVGSVTLAVGSAIEIRIPLIDLQFYSTELPYSYVAVGGGDYDVSCYNSVILPGAGCPIPVYGDVQNSGDVNSTDIVYLVNYVLKAGPLPMPCEANGDVNCTGAVNSTDIVYLVNYVLKGGPPPCDICSTIPGLWTCP